MQGDFLSLSLCDGKFNFQEGRKREKNQPLFNSFYLKIETKRTERKLNIQIKKKKKKEKCRDFFYFIFPL